MTLAFDGLIFEIICVVILAICIVKILYIIILLARRKKINNHQFGCAGIALLPILSFGFLTYFQYSTGPVQERPNKKNLEGTWVCRSLPNGFTSNANNPENTLDSKLVLFENGTAEAVNFPTSPGSRLESFSTTWSLNEPNATPSGNWSIVINDYFLIICKKNTLKLPISSNQSHQATFQKKH